MIIIIIIIIIIVTGGFVFGELESWSRDQKAGLPRR